MTFQPPGGSITWMTPLIAVGGGFVAVTMLMRGMPGLAAVFAVAAAAAVLTWFRVRSAAAVLIVYFSLALIAGVVALIGDEFTIRRLLRVLTTLFFVYELIQWYRLVGFERELARLELLASLPADPDEWEPEVEPLDETPFGDGDSNRPPAEPPRADADDPFGDRWRDAT